MRYCSLQRNVNLSVRSGIWHTAAYFDQINKDIDGLYDGKDEIVIPENGVYLFSAKITWQSNSAGQRLVRFVRENGDDTGTSDENATSGRDYIIHNWACYMTAGRKMRLQIMQTSGSTINAEMIQFKATKISD